MMIKKTFLGIVVLTCMLSVFSTSVFAVPSLGVATGGTYYVSSGDSYEDYQAYFASGQAPASENGGWEGFAIGSSPTSLTVFTNIIETDIYLLTDAYTADWNEPSLNSLSITAISSVGQANGYKPTPYYGINLGHSDSWDLLPSDPFQPDTTSFRMLVVDLEYSDEDVALAAGKYFFAAADTDNDGILEFSGGSAEPFSPKTSSAVSAPIPEPGTFLLLGIGIVGFVYNRKKLVG